ncbi:MAG: ribbon-helix-helix protein, CopG family [Ardenticatenaceae bacterium]|nr:ribbon-helix-helix protein, CopG family [Ardenticatenaceae bacterium]
MTRLGTFTFRVDDDEKQLIAALAARLQRNQSDTMRLLLRESAQALGVIGQDKKSILLQEVQHAETPS